MSRMWNDDETAALRDEYRRILFELLARAKEHGRIREDATDSDLDLIFWSVRGVVATTRGVTDTGWRQCPYQPSVPVKTIELAWLNRLHVGDKLVTAMLVPGVTTRTAIVRRSQQ